MKYFRGEAMRSSLFLLCLIFAAGCSDQTVVFKGEVHRGDMVYEYQIAGDSTTDVVETLYDMGGWAGSYVKEVSHQEVAYAAGSDGSYELKIKVPRKLGLPTADSYTLQAWGPSGQVARDEVITSYVNARPGETVHVRPFLLRYHTGNQGDSE